MPPQEIRPCSGILNIHIFIVDNPWTRPYFLGGGYWGSPLKFPWIYFTGVSPLQPDVRCTKVVESVDVLSHLDLFHLGRMHPETLWSLEIHPQELGKMDPPKDPGSKFQKKKFPKIAIFQRNSSVSMPIIFDYLCYKFQGAHPFIWDLMGCFKLSRHGFFSIAKSWKRKFGVERSKRNCRVNIRVDKCFK